MKPVVRFLAAGALAALSACRTAQMASPHASILTQAQADSLGDVVSADAQSELDAATASSGLGFIPGAPVGPLTANPLFCVPQISPMPPADADSDRVPDSVRITFDNCAIGFNNQDTVPGTIDRDAPLPSGTLTINGSSTVTFNDSTVFSLAVTTPTTLHRDATCGQRPQFDAGKVVAVVTQHGATATITIKFTACRQFTVTKS